MIRKSGTARVCNTLSYTASKQWSCPEPSSLPSVPAPTRGSPSSSRKPTNTLRRGGARGQRPEARGPGHSKAWLGAGAQAPGLREAGVVTPDHPEMGWLQINKGRQPSLATAPPSGSCPPLRTPGSAALWSWDSILISTAWDLETMPSALPVLPWVLSLGPQDVTQLFTNVHGSLETGYKDAPDLRTGVLHLGQSRCPEALPQGRSAQRPAGHHPGHPAVPLN